MVGTPRHDGAWDHSITPHASVFNDYISFSQQMHFLAKLYLYVMFDTEDDRQYCKNSSTILYHWSQRWKSLINVKLDKLQRLKSCVDTLNKSALIILEGYNS